DETNQVKDRRFLRRPTALCTFVSCRWAALREERLTQGARSNSTAAVEKPGVFRGRGPRRRGYSGVTSPPHPRRTLSIHTDYLTTSIFLLCSSQTENSPRLHPVRPGQHRLEVVKGVLLPRSCHPWVMRGERCDGAFRVGERLSGIGVVARSGRCSRR